MTQVMYLKFGFKDACQLSKSPYGLDVRQE